MTQAIPVQILPLGIFPALIVTTLPSHFVMNRIPEARPRRIAIVTAGIVLLASSVAVGSSYGLTEISKQPIPDSPRFGKRFLVCQGRTASGCAQSAARKSGFTVAWLRSTKDIGAYALAAPGISSGPTRFVYQELASIYGDQIQVTSNPPSPQSPGRTISRKVGRFDVAFRVEGSASDFDINLSAEWLTDAGRFQLSIIPHPMSQVTENDLIGYASRLIRRMQYATP